MRSETSAQALVSRRVQPAFTPWYLLLGLGARVAIQLRHGELQAFPSQVFVHRHHTCEVWGAAECIRPRLQQRRPQNTKSLRESERSCRHQSQQARQTSIHPPTCAHFLYLNYTQHSVVNHQRGVVSWDDGANQNPLHELPRGHQNVKPVAAVLHARLQDLAVNGARGGFKQR